MIAKMRKVTALCAERDRDALVQRLYDAGVVHVASLPTEVALPASPMPSGPNDTPRNPAGSAIMLVIVARVKK